MRKGRKTASRLPTAGTVVDAIDAAATVVGVIDAAVSLGQAAALIPAHRQCNITISNKCSDYMLCNPSVYTDSGSCADMLPRTIDPSSSGSALFTKTPNTARGAVGVFTYDLLKKSTKETTEKIAVMFSVPFDFNLYSSWYAVGVFDKSKGCNHDLYYQMYNNTDNTFVRSKANGSCLSYKGDRVNVAASMTNAYESVMKVEVSDV